MDIYQVGDIRDKKRFLKDLNVHGRGISIMANKMELLFFLIKDLKTPAINILKQDALSVGADLAVPSGVITFEDEYYDCLLIGTRKHIEILSYKELAQPFGLRTVAQRLRDYLKKKEYPVEIMGIINANGDSFFKDSRFIKGQAIKKIEEMIEEGATIIDIGGVSSRPNAEEVDSKEELKRVQPICNAVKKRKLYKKVAFSIDSHTPEVIEYALKSGFQIVNDITGGENNKVIQSAVKYRAKLVIMHKKGTPQNMQNNPVYDNVMVEISNFFEERIKKAISIGMKIEDIILDVGIGFGKTVEHNLTLINNMTNFKKFTCPILIGASRKSLIDNIVPTPIENRLAGTLAIHLKAIDNGANIVRCHDVKEHYQAIKVWEAMSPSYPT
jgi:dihydropteroate synthase